MSIISESVNMALGQASAMEGACKAIVPTAIVMAVTMSIPVISNSGFVQMLSMALFASGIIAMIVVYAGYRGVLRACNLECKVLITCSVLVEQLESQSDEDPDSVIPHAAIRIGDDLFRYAHASEAEIEACLEAALRRISAKGPSMSGDFFLDTPYSASQSS